MAIVYGQIQTLKKIKETLIENSLTEFNSTGELKEFVDNFNNYKETELFRVEKEYDVELEVLQTRAKTLKSDYSSELAKIKSRLNNKIESLDSKCNTLKTKRASNAFLEMAYWYKLLYFQFLRFILKQNLNRNLNLKVRGKKLLSREAEMNLNRFNSRRNNIISQRCEPKFLELDNKREIIRGLYPLIAGAKGEYMVQIELEKLSDNWVLFNDFSLKFDKPIYNKREKDRIYSIQIDHLLVTNAGVFIIETKNWSKKSIERLDLRSPIDQIKRASFALYVVLNNYKGTLDRGILGTHHWGEKEIPIRNVIVMINNKPSERFKHVTIKTVNEVNKYIKYFDPIFNDKDLKRVINRLKALQALNFA